MSLNNDPSKKITIKQFQWYQVETKVRQLLGELLQPFIKKQTEQTLKMNQMKRCISTLQEKVQEHNFFLSQQNENKPTYIQLQDQRIQEIRQNFDEMKVSQSFQINEMKKVIEIYEQKIKQVNLLQTKIQDQIQNRLSDNETYKFHLDKQIELMLNKLDSQDSQINNFKTTTRNNVVKVQSRVLTIQNKINDIESQMKRKSKQIIKINQSLSMINQKSQNHQIKIDDLVLRISNREKDQKLSQKFFGKAIQLGNQLAFLRNYLTFYQPIYTQVLISDTMHSFIKGPMKARLCLFQQQIFAKLHYNVLTTETDSLQDLMSNFSNKLSKIINRNKKYIIRFKIDQTLKYGTNVYQIREIDNMLIDRMEEDDNKPAPVVIPEQKIMQLVQNKWEKLSHNIENKVKDLVQPTRTWIHQIQDQSILRIIQNDNKIEQIQKSIEKQQTNFSLFKLELGTLQKQANKKIQQIEDLIIEEKESLKDIISFSSVINHIIIQDQIDKQGLALYALSKNSHQPIIPPTIKLDQKCLHCSDPSESNLINQAFKMACLSYNPSHIKIEDKQFSRQQILEISTSLLQKLKKKISTRQDQNKIIIDQARRRRSRSSLQQTRPPKKQMNETMHFRTIQSRGNKRHINPKQLKANLPDLGMNSKKLMAKTSNSFSVFY